MMLRSISGSFILCLGLMACGKQKPVEIIPQVPEKPEVVTKKDTIVQKLDAYYSKNLDVKVSEPGEVDTTSIDTFACKLNISVPSSLRKKVSIILEPHSEKDAKTYHILPQKTNQFFWVYPAIYQMKIKVGNDSTAIPVFLTRAGSTYSCSILRK